MKKILQILVFSILICNGMYAAALSVQQSGAFEQIDESFKMVIISPAIFASNIQPLIDHKNSVGIESFFKSTEDIYNEYSGYDEAEKIKYFIKDAIETYNISYVFLIGGKVWQFNKWHVPVRYSQIDDGFDYSFCISDLYFADIYDNEGNFSSWDTDKDGLYGEWIVDDVDLIPDVYVGRLPCRNRFDVMTVVNKIISYETGSFGQSWFDTFVAIGGDTFPNFAGYEGEETCEVALSFLPEFTPKRLYVSTGNLTGSDDVIEAINQGCGFVMTRGKGGTERVRIPKNDGSELIILKNELVKSLQNKDQYPIVFLSECYHGKIDVSILNWLKYLRNESDIMQQDTYPWTITWLLLKEKDGGAIAVITNTNTCYGTSGDVNSNGIPDDAEQFGGGLTVDSLRQYGVEGYDILGEIHYKSIEQYVSSFPVYSNTFHGKSVQEYTLFGDPSLKIGGYS
jgi:hypothetical protein